MRLCITIIGILFFHLGFATEQTPDILIYKKHKVFIDSFPLETRVQSDSTLDDKLNEIECFSTDCWRRVIGVWKVENDSLFLIELLEPCEHQKLSLENFFDKNEIKDEKVFANWYSDEIKSGYGKCLGFSDSEWENIYENEIKVIFENGVVKELSVQNQVKSKLLGSWGNDDLGNAIFAFYTDSIYYPDANLRYKYSINSDTILIEKEDKYIEKIRLLDINDEALKLEYIDYEIIETYDKRKWKRHANKS